MFIEQIFKYRYEFWRYIVGFLIIIAAIILGQIPLTIAIFLKGGYKVLNMDQTQMLHLLDSNYSLFLLLLTYAVGLVGILLVAKLLHKEPIRALTTSRPKIDWGRIFFSFGVIAAFLIISTLLDYWVNPGNYVLNFHPRSFFILFMIAIIFIPLQTSFEEYLFRGYLMQGFGALFKNRWLPLLLTSIIFGGLHFFNPEVSKLGDIIMFSYIGTGFLLGIITLMDEGMELSLGFHAANNLVIALLVTTDWTAFQTESILKDVSSPSAGYDVFLPLIVVYPLFVLLLAKKYKWHNWKEKLTGKVEKPLVVYDQE